MGAAGERHAMCELTFSCVGGFIFPPYLPNRRQPIAPPVALPALRLNAVCREVEQSVWS
jgi:hypothetical protein